jgi:hypothetical protein
LSQSPGRERLRLRVTWRRVAKSESTGDSPVRAAGTKKPGGQLTAQTKSRGKKARRIKKARGS